MRNSDAFCFHKILLLLNKGCGCSLNTHAALQIQGRVMFYIFIMRVICFYIAPLQYQRICIAFALPLQVLVFDYSDNVWDQQADKLHSITFLL